MQARGTPPEGYPDNNFPITGGQGIHPHDTRDGYHYRFVNNNGIFGLKIDVEGTNDVKIVGVIEAEEHVAMVGAHLLDGAPLQNRDEMIASLLGVGDQ